MKVYSYVVKDDRGFAPNPFWNYMTLATSQPLIRLMAEIGDWIVGLSESADGKDHSLLFAFKISEKMTFTEYWNDSRFEGKKPDFSLGQTISEVGDNIYQPEGNEFIQQTSLHSIDNFDSEEKWFDQKKTDLQGKYVLISEKYEFYYFGKKPIKIPDSKLVDELYCDIGHKCIADPIIPQAFVEFIHKLHKENKIGFQVKPSDWPANDDSWKQCQAKV